MNESQIAQRMIDRDPECKKAVLEQGTWDVVMWGERVYTFADGSTLKEKA